MTETYYREIIGDTMNQLLHEKENENETSNT